LCSVNKSETKKEKNGERENIEMRNINIKLNEIEREEQRR